MFSNTELLCSQASEPQIFFYVYVSTSDFSTKQLLFDNITNFPLHKQFEKQNAPNCPDYIPHHSLLVTRTYYLAFNKSSLK